MSEAMRCRRCGCFYNLDGKRVKAYTSAIRFVQKSGKWVPVCSDKEGCDSRMNDEEPTNFWFGPARKRGRKKRIQDEET